jgi:hypothetical protein
MTRVGGCSLKQYIEEVLRRTFTMKLMQQMNVAGKNKTTAENEKFGLGTTHYYRALYG